MPAPLAEPSFRGVPMSGSDPLDYYHFWLGIPREEQPPTHYKLLGIKLFESDVNVICNAADRQMAHVKSYQNGPNRAISQKLLNELSAAQVSLLNPTTKRDYDEGLRKSLIPPASMPAPPQASTSTPPAPPVELPIPDFLPVSVGVKTTPLGRKKTNSVLPWGLSLGGLIVIVLFLFLLSRNNEHAMELVDVVAKVERSVVRIDTDVGVGSGVIVDDRGFILTNYHVIARASYARITLRSGAMRQAQGYLVIDRGRDLALLKTDNFTKPVAITIAATLPRNGEKVAAFGSPEGFSFSTSEGIVAAIRSGREVSGIVGSSYRDRNFDLAATWIQSTAAISGGNSGGPLVNMNGELIGINTFSFNRSTAQNLNFAIGLPDIRQLVGKARGAPLGDLAKLPFPLKSTPNPKEQEPRPFKPPASTDEPDVPPRFPLGLPSQPPIVSEDGTNGELPESSNPVSNPPVARPKKHKNLPPDFNKLKKQAALEAIKDPQPHVRRQAALEMAVLGADDSDVINALRETLNDPDSNVRDAAVHAIGVIGPGAVDAVPALLNLWKSDRNTRNTVLFALGRMADKSKPALDFVIRVARENLMGGRVLACKTLGEIGETATPAVPLLIEILKSAAKDADRELELFETVTTALGNIGDQRAISPLQDLLSGKGLRGTYNLERARVLIDTAIRRLQRKQGDAEEKDGERLESGRE